jgi:dihydrofolate reductase
MAKLTYFAMTSLDGYHSDADGTFDWAAPDEEVHAFVNDLERDVGTYLYGRRMYETMTYWETDEAMAGDPVEQDYAAIWRSADKVVYSTTLAATVTARTRLESSFDAAAVAQLKAEAARDLGVGGPNLAASALRAGLVDDIHVLVAPVVVGGGARYLPDDIRLQLELIGSRTFRSGVVFLHYRVT